MFYLEIMNLSSGISIPEYNSHINLDFHDLLCTIRTWVPTNDLIVAYKRNSNGFVFTAKCRQSGVWIGSGIDNISEDHFDIWF